MALSQLRQTEFSNASRWLHLGQAKSRRIGLRSGQVIREPVGSGKGQRGLRRTLGGCRANDFCVSEPRAMQT